MLRGASSPRVLDYRLEWDGKPPSEDLAEEEEEEWEAERSAVRRISLFNEQADVDGPIFPFSRFTG